MKKSVPTLVVLVLLVTGCSGDGDLAGLSLHSTTPTPCFAGVEKALAQVADELFEQRRSDGDLGPIDLPDGGSEAHCSVRFTSEALGTPGTPWKRSISVRYSLASPAIAPSDAVGRARDSYLRQLDTAPESARLRPISAGDEGASWHQDGTFAGGHAAFVDRNLAVKVHVEGGDSTDEGDSGVGPMSPEDAQDDAIRIAESVAESLLETRPR
ncbi:hypothetical protein FHR81_002188 [Actinoalloteichus hoggarensis]|uniref:Uncharacterized protein n=1 Tax=Actinoalloteichus hoggarensis TaxID=1470176 RepID=A0A221W5N8_9PSEU|nr:hypothetical protein [Actinoalloteichus hoggarensis]ASO21220.1 hypothetical protein AHOG_17975 [Actinoalloteichus hoggarensis]MBB5921150.1 hypothetical protein [Actinoalloteichus hoggarensis]